MISSGSKANILKKKIFRSSLSFFFFKIILAVIIATFLFSFYPYLTKFLQEFYNFFKIEEIFKIKIANPKIFSTLSIVVILIIIMQPFIPFLMHNIFNQFSTLEFKGSYIAISQYSIKGKITARFKIDSIRSYQVKQSYLQRFFKSGDIFFFINEPLNNTEDNPLYFYSLAEIEKLDSILLKQIKKNSYL